MGRVKAYYHEETAGNCQHDGELEFYQQTAHMREVHLRERLIESTAELRPTDLDTLDLDC